MMDLRPWILSAKFLRAIEEKDVKTVTSILDSGFDVDANLMFHKNAINICVSNGWYEMAQLLIGRGCSLSLKNELGQQPLTVAVLKSDYALVKLLLDNRADKTCMDLQRKSALHYACELNNLRIVKLLSETGGRHLNLRCHYRMTPLSYACGHGSAALVQHLLDKGAEVNVIDYFRRTPLLSAVCNMQCTPEMVEALLNAGADINHINSASESALLCALRTYSERVAKSIDKRDTQFQKICLLLIEHGCDVDVQNSQHETALHLAVHLNDQVLVRKLLNSGCAVNVENKLELGPLFYACQNGAPDIVSLLVEGGATTDGIHDNTPEKWPWYVRRGGHLQEDYAQVLHVLKQSRKCRLLSELCRRAIRRSLSPEVEKRALRLPLPTPLVSFILLT